MNPLQAAIAEQAEFDRRATAELRRDIATRQTAIDAERLIQWALAPGHCGGLPWREDPELAFDRGLTVRPRRQARGSWALVLAGAGAVAGGRRREIVLAAIGDGDAELVRAAIMALPGAAAALVLRHGRHKTRPCWTDRVAEWQPKWRAPGYPVIAYGDRKRRAQPYCVLDVDYAEVATPQAICRYETWWSGVERVGAAVDGRLDRWFLSGFAAPMEPWRQGA